MTPRGLRLAAAALLALGVAGCGVRAPGPQTGTVAAQDAYEERARRLADLAAWTLNGRVTVQGPEESGQVRVRFRKDAEGSRLEVRNPFGQTLLRLTRDGTGVRLRDDQGRLYTGEAARRVLRARLGWRVPVGRLNEWVLGLAQAREVPAAMDGKGRPLRIEAGRWRIHYPRYMQVKGMWLPKEVQVGHNGLDLRIRVDRWRLEWPEGQDREAAA